MRRVFSREVCSPSEVRYIDGIIGMFMLIIDLQVNS